MTSPLRPVLATVTRSDANGLNWELIISDEQRSEIWRKAGGKLARRHHGEQGFQKKRPHQSASDQSRQQSKPHEPALEPGTVPGSETGGFGPEMMLGLWTSWMEANSRSAHERTDQDQPRLGE